MRTAAYTYKSRWQRFEDDKPGYWDQFFQDPSQFWDQRETKLNHNYADFEHKKDSQCALWIDRDDQDLRQRLAQLDRTQDLSSRVPAQSPSAQTFSDHLMSDALRSPLSTFNGLVIEAST